MALVLAKDLTHVKVRQTVHLWQINNGTVKSLTNGYTQFQIERLSAFNLNKVLGIICSKYNVKKVKRLPNGFLYVDHYTQTSGYIEGETWDENVENVLLDREYIFIQ